MTVQVFFPFKAMGVNHYQKSTRQGRRYTTKEGKEFQIGIHNQLTKARAELDYLLKKFSDSQSIEMELYVYQKNFYCKGTQRINKRAGDVDGPSKIVIDQVFKFLDIDDALLTSFKCMKIPSDKDCFVIGLSTCAHPELHELLSQSA